MADGKVNDKNKQPKDSLAMSIPQSTTEELWQNICIGCGQQTTTHGGELPGPCPGCNGWRFMCHLQNPTEPLTIDKPEGGQGNTQPTISLPLNWQGKEGMTPKVRDGDNDLVPNGGIAKRDKLQTRVGDTPGKGNGHRGRPQTTIPETLFKSLVDKGLGCKAIAKELTQKGFSIHYTTIARHLNKGGVRASLTR